MPEPAKDAVRWRTVRLKNGKSVRVAVVRKRASAGTGDPKKRKR